MSESCCRGLTQPFPVHATCCYIRRGRTCWALRAHRPTHPPSQALSLSLSLLVSKAVSWTVIFTCSSSFAVSHRINSQPSHCSCSLLEWPKQQREYSSHFVLCVFKLVTFAYTCAIIIIIVLADQFVILLFRPKHFCQNYFLIFESPPPSRSKTTTTTSVVINKSWR